MKTALLLLSMVCVAAAELETGFFGPTDQADSPEVLVIIAGPHIISWERGKTGEEKYTVQAEGGAPEGKAVTKEEFTQCYHLASKAIREYRRATWPKGPRYEFHTLSINRLHDNILLSYEASAVKENPALAKLLATLKNLAKTR